MLFRGGRFAARLGYNLFMDLPKINSTQAYYSQTLTRFFTSTQSENKFNYFDFGYLFSSSLFESLSVKMIPHPEKAHKGGEDAFFSNKK